MFERDTTPFLSSTTKTFHTRDEMAFRSYVLEEGSRLIGQAGTDPVAKERAVAEAVELERTYLRLCPGA